MSITKIFYGLGRDANIMEGDPRHDRVKHVWLPPAPGAPDGFKLDWRFGGRHGQLELEDADRGQVDGHDAATWTLKAYALNFDGNGGTVDGEARLFDGPGTDADGTFDVSGTVATRPGYTFLGWSADAGGDGGMAGTDGKYTIPEGYEDTLYAQWERAGGFELPKTGGTGTAPFVAAGSMAVLLAGLAGLVLARRKGRG